MSDDEAVSRLESALEGIAGVHGTGIQMHEMDDGRWVLSIETEEKGAVRAEGFSLLEALSHLQRNAKAEGWA